MTNNRWFTTKIYGLAQFDTQEKANHLLSAICRHANYVPDKYDWAEPVREKFSLANFDGPITVLRNQQRNQREVDDPVGRILLKRTKTPKHLFFIEWSGIRIAPFGVSSYDIDASYLEKNKNLAEWLEFSFELLPIHDTWFASLCTTDEADWKNRLDYLVPANAPQRMSPGTTVQSYWGSHLHENIPGIYWGNYFGPAYVEWFGREKFASLSCVYKIELDTGGFFFTTAENPQNWNTPECRKLQRQIMDELGLDAFFYMERLHSDIARFLGKGNVYDPGQLIPKYRVPDFPFSSIYQARRIELQKKRHSTVIAEQQKMGFQLKEELEHGRLLFENKNGAKIIVDIENKVVSHYPVQ